MRGDDFDFDSAFDFNGDGKYDSFERNEYELFTFGDGSMHEPDGISPGSRRAGGLFDNPFSVPAQKKNNLTEKTINEKPDEEILTAEGLSELKSSLADLERENLRVIDEIRKLTKERERLMSGGDSEK